MECKSAYDTPSCDNAIYEEVKAVPNLSEVQLTKNDCYVSVEKSSNDSFKSSVVKKRSSKKVVVAIFLTLAVLVLLLGAAGTTAYALAEISKVKSDTLSANQAVLQQFALLEVKMTHAQVAYQEAAQQALSTLQQQSALNDSSLETRLDRVADISRTAYQQLNRSIYTLISTSSVDPVSSCNDLPSSFPAGYYYISSSTGSAVRQYCPSITTRCGQTGRWHSVANLDMTNSTQQCFSGLRQHIYSNKRLCVRNSDSSGCSSVQLPTNTAYYKSVCGLVKAYQFGSPDAFNPSSLSSSIDSPYVDGVSITHGSPRQHIWTFAATSNENSGHHGCPCTGGSNSRPAFVGNDYFCDTGTSTGNGAVFYGDDPLWDGAGCGPANNCCSFNTPPWFHKELSQDISDDIELRVCSDHVRSSEDVAIESVEMFVK